MHLLLVFTNLGSVTDSSHLNSLEWIHNAYWGNISREKWLGIIIEKGWKSFGCSGRFQRAINMISESFSSPNLALSLDASCLLSSLGFSSQPLSLLNLPIYSHHSPSLHQEYPMLLLCLLDFCCSSELLFF